MIWLWRAIVVLACGTALTLLLAFGCALVSPLSPACWGSRTNDSPWLAFSHERGFGRDLYQVSASHIVWPSGQDWTTMKRATLPAWVDPGPDFPTHAHLVCIGAGWPATALTARLENLNAVPPGPPLTTPAPSGAWQHALVLRRARSVASVGDRILPLRIEPAGMLTNLGFWSAATIAVLLAARCARTVVRRWRHRCAHCGYDLRGHLAHGAVARATGCPECGWRRLY